MSKQFDSSKHPKIHFMLENMIISKQNLGVAIGFGSSSSINGSDKMLGCESLSLSRFVRSKMERSSFVTLRVKKKCRAIMSV